MSKKPGKRRWSLTLLYSTAFFLIQLAAVRSALNNTGKVILKDHLEHCIVEAVENHDHATIEELNRAIEQFVK